MRLPARTQKQQQREDSRAWCERLYRALIDGKRTALVVTPDTIVDMQAKVSANTRFFWSSRGYRIRTKSSEDRCTLWVWIEEGPSMKRAKVRRQVVETAWAQPA